MTKGGAMYGILFGWFALTYAATAYADMFSESHKIGAFSGAMKYCEKKYDEK